MIGSLTQEYSIMKACFSGNVSCGKLQAGLSAAEHHVRGSAGRLAACAACSSETPDQERLCHLSPQIARVDPADFWDAFFLSGHSAGPPEAVGMLPEDSCISQ